MRGERILLIVVLSLVALAAIAWLALRLYIEYSPAFGGCEPRYLTIERLDGPPEAWLTLNESIVADFPAVARDLLLQAEREGSARAPIEPEDSKQFRNVLLREEIAQDADSPSRWEYRGNYYEYWSPIC